MEIRDSSQISTTAPIFLLSNYFRQKYLEIDSCAISLLNNIWVRVEHSLLQQQNLQQQKQLLYLFWWPEDELTTSIKTALELFGHRKNGDACDGSFAEEFCIDVLILRPVSICNLSINFQNSKSFVSIKSFENITASRWIALQPSSFRNYAPDPDE